MKKMLDKVNRTGKIVVDAAEIRELLKMVALGAGKPVDLRVCIKGDLLLTKQGNLLTYSHSRKAETNYCPHVVIYSSGQYGTRCDDGFVFPNKRSEEDEDVIMVLGQ